VAAATAVQEHRIELLAGVVAVKFWGAFDPPVPPMMVPV
jgi:hypothetical protein